MDKNKKTLYLNSTFFIEKIMPNPVIMKKIGVIIILTISQNLCSSLFYNQSNFDILSHKKLELI